MKTITEYFEEAAKKAGNYTRLAEALGMTQQAMSMYRSAHRIPDPTAAAKLAIYLNIKEFEVIAAAELARAKTPEARKLWDSLGKRWAATAAVLLTLGGGGFPYRAEAGMLDINEGGGFYISQVSRNTNYTRFRRIVKYLGAIIANVLSQRPQPI